MKRFVDFSTFKKIAGAIAILAFALFSAAAPAGDGPGVEIRDTEQGEGPEANRNDTVTVHYTGWLEDGTEFDSSHSRNQPFTLTLGAGQVIPGWEQGIRGMREGGVRELVIPPELGYGPRGAGNVIPPNATLRFEVELLEIEPAPFSGLDNEGLAEKIEEGVTIVDIRRPEEWAETGVVEGSHRITAFDGNGRFNPEFGEQFAALVDRDEPVVLICRTGNRTGALARALVEGLGYQQVYNVTDGIMEWLGEERVVQRDCPDHQESTQC